MNPITLPISSKSSQSDYLAPNSFLKNQSLVSYLKSEVFEPYIDWDDSRWTLLMDAVQSQYWYEEVSALIFFYRFGVILENEELEEFVLEALLDLIEHVEIEELFHFLHFGRTFFRDLEKRGDLAVFLEKVEMLAEADGRFYYKIEGLISVFKTYVVMNDLMNASKVFEKAYLYISKKLSMRTNLQDTFYLIKESKSLLYIGVFLLVIASINDFNLFPLYKVFFKIGFWISITLFFFNIVIFSKKANQKEKERSEEVKESFSLLEQFSFFKGGLSETKLALKRFKVDVSDIDLGDDVQEMKLVAERLLVELRQKHFFQKHINALTPNERKVYELAREIEGVDFGIDFDGTMIPSFKEGVLLDDLTEESRENDVNVKTKRFWERAALPPGIKPFLLGIIEQSKISIITAATRGHATGFPVWIPFLEKFMWWSDIDVYDRSDVRQAYKGRLNFKEEESSEGKIYSINGTVLTSLEVKTLWNQGSRLKFPDKFGVDILLEDHPVLESFLKRAFGDESVFTLREYWLIRDSSQPHSVMGKLTYSDGVEEGKMFNNVEIATEEEYDAEVLRLLPLLERLKEISDLKNKPMLFQDEDLFEEAI